MQASHHHAARAWDQVTKGNNKAPFREDKLRLMADHFLLSACVGVIGA